MKSCVECKLYPKCDDRKKGIDYWCKDFKRLKIRSGSILEILESGEEVDEQAPSLVLTSTIDEKHLTKDAEFNLMSMIEESITNPNPIPRDMKIDDRDLKEFPNFYEWCMSPDGANQPPYARQLAIGIHLFGQYCVAKGTLIQTDRGLVPVESMSGAGVSIMPHSSKVATLLGTATTSHAGLTSKRRKCLRVTNCNGHSLEVTPEHKLAVLSKDYSVAWKEAGQLTKDDILVSAWGRNLWPRSQVRLPKWEQNTTTSFVRNGSVVTTRHVGVGIPRTPKVCGTELAELVGYITSDGSISKWGISFCNANRTLAYRFVALVKSQFGVELPVLRETLPTGTIFYRAGCSFRAIPDFFTHIGFPRATCYYKDVPEFIMRSPKRVVIAYIRALIDCDGWIQNGRVGIELSAPTLVKKVHLH